jgi:hypothetical protein
MRMRILAVATLLLANVPLAWGQPAPETAVVPPPPIETGRPILFGKNSFVADDAEHAEDLADAKSRFWFRTEFMLWFIKPANFPALVTTGASTDPAPGALGSLNTSVLFGGAGIDFQDRSGGRFTAGYWLDDERQLGLEAGYVFVGGRALGQTFASPGSPILAVPFFNVNTGAQDSSVVTYPGIMSGSVSVAASTFMQGAEANFTKALWQSESLRVEALGGFRWLNLTESLSMESVSLVQLAPQYQGFGIPYDGNTITVNDHFETRNNFYGGQIGTRAELEYQRWTLELRGKVALGVTNEAVLIRGNTSIDTQPATNGNAGLFALASNSGLYTRNVFGVVPEANATVKFQLTDNIRLFAGYTFTFWTGIVRPGDQIDAAVNQNLVPTSNTYGVTGGPVRPAFSFHSTSFFAHGANFGVEVRW